MNIHEEENKEQVSHVLTPQLDEVDKGREKVQCEKCGKEFASYRSLGGHTSKVHPGESATYNHMICVRKKRELDRKALQMAKIESKTDK